MDRQSLYLAMYQECCIHGRHHEVQRTQITTICFALVGAVLGYIAKDGHIKREHFWLGMLLTVLGLLAAFLGQKQYERFRQSMTRAAAYRDAIDKVIDPCADAPGVDRLKQAADARHKRKFLITRLIPLHLIWSAFFVLTAGLGLLIGYNAKKAGAEPPPAIQHVSVDLHPAQ